MIEITKKEIENLLKSCIDLNTETDLVSAKSIKKITITDTDINVDIVLGYPSKSYLPKLQNAVKKTLQTLPTAKNINIEITFNICSHSVQKHLKPLPNIKNIIAISSAKGGVGKSTTAVNLALALVAEGANVGILDADIYGPSIPTMLGLSGHPISVDGKSMDPKIGHGIQTISIGYLVDKDKAVIWRGPMVTNALQQLLNETNWNNIDYLIVDLPPGTGDIQLTLTQKIPVTGVVIITTPQDIALIDAQRGLAMFNKVNIKILGLVENMGIHICSACGREEAIFGLDGGMIMSQKNNINFLGSLPLERNIREFTDLGTPIVIAQPESNVAKIYKTIARKMSAKLALQGQDYSHAFPNVVVQNPK